MKILKLDEVTLVCASSVHRRRSLSALAICMRKIDFGDVRFFTHQKMSRVPTGIDLTIVPPFQSIDDYSRFMIYSLGDFVETTHALVVQSDGYVIHPESWTNEFLDFDYVGAPWPIVANAYVDPFGVHQRVGNGGFSLRSKRLLDVPKQIDIPWDVNSGDFYQHMGAELFSEDGNICVHNRHLYESQGCRFALPALAARFSQEIPVPESRGVTPFGFHHRLPGRRFRHRAPVLAGYRVR